MLPVIDGLSVCKILKSKAETKNCPIIMLTAKSSERDIVDGLETGADDYVTKPFSNKVLIARIKAQLRKQEAKKIIEYRELSIDINSRIVLLNGEQLDFTFSEFEILSSFAKHPGRVYTRSELIAMLRGDDGFDITERAIDFQILNIRRKLGEFGSNIQTVRGLGYKLGELK